MMISGHGNIETAVSAIRRGAYDFIEKPFKADRLILVAERALETSKLKREVSDLKQRSGETFDLIGMSSAMSQLRQTIERVAPTNSRIMIIGPSGSGKEVAGRAIHALSARKSGPFVTLSAANITPERMEIELFGTESNGTERKVGALEETHRDILYIDEVTDMPRETRNKSVYARKSDGKIISNGLKKGVPLSDVWDIPFLNPKAKERTGYPTQKPILLLKRIIELTTEPGDLILDPFCGSGTTLVASKLMGRNAIGIDISWDAISLTKERLQQPIETKSILLEKGRSSYENRDEKAAAHLSGIDYIPIHRNKGIDGLLKNSLSGVPTFIRCNVNTRRNMKRPRP